jgi:dTDP-4-amino-4,6-dideoxygalactose transaminase
MDLDSVEGALTSRTSAIIAVNFLGIPERLGVLRSLARRAGALLIEDSAQALPQAISGDMTILSFGRGKPVSLLGGGAVLTRDPALASLLPQLKSECSAAWKWRLTARIHNALINPRLYGIACRMPFLHIGETRFRLLRRLAGAPPELGHYFGANMNAYRARSGDVSMRIAEAISHLVDNVAVDLPSVCLETCPSRLLRYPLLILAEDLCAHVLAWGRREGLGISRMYKVPLPLIAGLKGNWDTEHYPNAVDFARQLITIPTHSSFDADAQASFARSLKSSGYWH